MRHYIRNSISNMVRYNPETGGSISRPENINGNWNMNGGKIDTEGRYDKKWGNRDQRGR